MTINLSVPKTESDLKPRIIVVGVGGAGGNAVNNMMRANLEGVEFIATNTDAQALAQSQAERKIQLGRNITQGLGAGSRPDIGRASAEEALDEIMDHLEGGNMVFVAAGMGGGTGTGAAPVLARGAREQGILTVGVVTKPFHFEGTHRMRVAEGGVEELQQYVDTLIIIPNQNLFRVANEKTTFAEAFKMADDVLYCGVRGVTDLMVMPGLINLDFADIRSVMGEMGKAMMGTGEAAGERRSIEAAEAAISNPLLEDISMKGARGVLINITGGPDMTLFEVDEAANRIRDEVDSEANIIFGSTCDESLDSGMRVSVVATGIEAEAVKGPRPAPLSLVSDTGRPSAPTGPAWAVAGGSPTPLAIEDETADAAPEGDPQPAAIRVPATDGADAAEWLITRVNEETPKRPVTMAAKPEAGSASDPFIAPEPVPVGDQATPASATEAADPFAAAALENGGREPKKQEQRAPSLFL
ncbi:MAG: cell division protein FtsZ, partial [Kiloniellales bacterium]